MPRTSRMGAIAKRMALAAAAAACLRVLWLWKKQHNRITYNEGSHLTSSLVQRLRHVLSKYHGPAWLPTGLLQTVSTELLPVPELPLRREAVTLPEMARRPESTCCPAVVPEGHVSIDWLDVQDRAAPVVLIVPGLTGDSSSGYVRRVAEHLHNAKGFRVACYNPRGRGGNDLASPFLYSVGYTEDLRRVVRHVAQAYPEARVMAAGFSLGSNYLAKFVGEEGDGCELTAAACLACPVDCLSISNALENTVVGRTVMDPVLVSSVQRVREAFEHLLLTDERYDMDRIKGAKTMHEFDGAVIAKMFEFSSASSYYRWSSAGLFLDRIRRPTLFVHAQNDPIVSSSAVKLDDFRESPFLINCMTREGGHSMDWPQASTLKPWSAEVIGEFFAAAASHADAEPAP